MTSERAAYAWVFLPGDTEPTLCGRFEHGLAPGGGPVGSFVYGRKYLGNKLALPLDPVALPLQPRLFETTGASQGVFGVFSDACPDDWGRYVIDRRHGAQAYPLGYLLRSQEDRVGNLCFSGSPDEPPELAPPTPMSLLDEAWLVVTGLDAGREIPPELEEKIRFNTALGGARPKLTVADDQAQWLAKFPSKKDDPRWSLARAELAMLDLARRCKIDVAHAKIHCVPESEFSEGGDILLVKRFDRAAFTQGEQSDGEVAWLRDAYVSARTVLLSDSHGAPSSFGGSYAKLARDLQRWSANPVVDRLELFRRMVFNCCISNTDDHDRNHGFVASEDGRGFRLAPAFDMVPRLHGTQRRYQAMNIGDRAAEASTDNLLSAAGAFGIGEGRARDIVEEVQAEVLQSWRDCLLEAGLAEPSIDLLAACFAPLPVSFDDLPVPADRASWRAMRGW